MNHATNVANDTVYLLKTMTQLGKEAILRGASFVGQAVAHTSLVKSLGPKKSAAVASFATAMCLAAVFVVVLEDFSDERPADCPAHAGLKPRLRIAGGPISLLEQAQKANAGGDWSSEGKESLEKCVRWQAPAGANMPLDELRAQIECHSLFVGTLKDNQLTLEESGALNERTRSILHAVHATNDKCDAFTSRLSSVKKTASDKPSEAIVALSGLAGFETEASNAASALQTVSSVLEQQMMAGDWDAEDMMYEIAPMRIKFRSCLLKAAKDSRAVAQALAGSPQAERAQRCRPDMLVGLEKLAFAEAEQDTDPGVLFSSGLLMSEVGVAPAGTPFFGRPTQSQPALTQDAKGLVVPRQIAESEEMLLQGLQASIGPDETEKAALSAIRLCQHAKFLMDTNHEAAVEWRYRAGAALATRHGRDKLAAHTFGQLSYFLHQRGKDDIALEAANEAMEMGNDPLASYLQVALRLNLGHLRTVEQVRDAKEQLVDAQGKLPSKLLEDARSATYSNLVMWNKISATGSSEKCLEMADAAEIMICMLGKAAYNAA